MALRSHALTFSFSLILLCVALRFVLLREDAGEKGEPTELGVASVDLAGIVDTGSDLIHSTVDLWEEGTVSARSRPVASLVLTLKALAALERIVVD